MRRSPICVAGAACVLTAALSVWLFVKDKSQGRLSEPRIVIPAQVNLGPKQAGHATYADIEVANVGDSELQLTDFRASCACAGVVETRDGSDYILDCVRVGSHSKGNLRIKIRVNADPLSALRVLVQFRTNDPSHPIGEVGITIPQVTGGLVGYPRTLLLGNISVGETVEREIEILDYKEPPRPIRSLLCTDSRIQMTVQPVHEVKGERRESVGVLAGRLKLRISSDQPGELNAMICISTPGVEAVDAVNVLGRFVAGPFVTPEVARMIRDESAGKWTARALIRVPSGSSTMVKKIRKPDFLNVRIEPTSNKSQFFLTLSTALSANERILASPESIEIDLETDGRLGTVAIPVEW